MTDHHIIQTYQPRAGNNDDRLGLTKLIRQEHHPAKASAQLAKRADWRMNFSGGPSTCATHTPTMPKKSKLAASFKKAYNAVEEMRLGTTDKF